MLGSYEWIQPFLVFGFALLMGTLWTIFRVIDLYRQIKQSRYRLILDLLETAVQKTYETYTREIKRARADGKLTPEERQHAMELAIQHAYELAKAHRIDLQRWVHSELLRYLLQRALRKLKFEKAITTPNR